jgi:hypothetical protein
MQKEPMTAKIKERLLTALAVIVMIAFCVFVLFSL